MPENAFTYACRTIFHNRSVNAWGFILEAIITPLLGRAVYEMYPTEEAPDKCLMMSQELYAYPSCFHNAWELSFDELFRASTIWYVRWGSSYGKPLGKRVSLLEAISTGTGAEMETIPGVNSKILLAVSNAVKTAYSESFRMVFLASIAVGGLSLIAALFSVSVDDKPDSFVAAKLSGTESAKESVTDVEKTAEPWPKKDKPPIWQLENTGARILFLVPGSDVVNQNYRWCPFATRYVSIKYYGDVEHLGVSRILWALIICCIITVSLLTRWTLLCTASLVGYIIICLKPRILGNITGMRLLKESFINESIDGMLKQFEWTDRLLDRLPL